MQQYIDQAKHNDEFHSQICEAHPDKFFDWKITCLFYCAYHLMKGLADKWGVDIGNRHSDILKNMNPKNANRAMHVKKEIFYAYDRLFEYSWTARYDGIMNISDYEIAKKGDYDDALKKYNYIKAYAAQHGIVI